MLRQAVQQNPQVKNVAGCTQQIGDGSYTQNDYKELGLHALVPPCVLRLAKAGEYQFMVVRSGKDQMREISSFLEAAWHNVAPDVPCRGYLQSDLIEKEIRMAEGFRSIAFFLAFVTLLLSASGLFAQISLNIDRRGKEIGVRKVLGASIPQIILLINREFMRILLIAFVVGSILGYLFTSRFVFRIIYQYHPDTGPMAYIGTFLIVFLCCGMIIGMKVFEAARANPTDRLRNE